MNGPIISYTIQPNKMEERKQAIIELDSPRFSGYYSSTCKNIRKHIDKLKANIEKLEEIYDEIQDVETGKVDMWNGKYDTIVINTTIPVIEDLIAKGLVREEREEEKERMAVDEVEEEEDEEEEDEDSEDFETDEEEEEED
jgi:hypothetical protein